MNMKILFRIYFVLAGNNSSQNVSSKGAWMFSVSTHLFDNIKKIQSSLASLGLGPPE